MALVRAANPDLSAAQTIQIVKETATIGIDCLDLDGDAVTDEASNFTPCVFDSEAGLWTDGSITITDDKLAPVPGAPPKPRSDYYGYGLVNARRAVEKALAVGAADGEKSLSFVESITDPLFPFQWHLASPNSLRPDSDVTTGTSAPLPTSTIDAVGAWELFDPRSASAQETRIAVIDDGVATNFPRGEINLVAQYDVSLLPGAGGQIVESSCRPLSGTGHGTTVAGLAAGAANGYGTVGVAPGFPIIGIRVPGNQGDIEDTLRTDLVQDLDIFWAFLAAVEADASVICCSLTPKFSEGICQEPNYASAFMTLAEQLAVVVAYDNDVPVVWAAGNQADNADAWDLFGVFGPQDGVTDPGGEQSKGGTGIEAVLVVSASNSLLGGGVSNADKMVGAAHYTNYGRTISVSGPSGDPQPAKSDSECADDLSYRLLRAGLVGPDLNFLGMGGEVFDRKIHLEETFSTREPDGTVNVGKPSFETPVELPPAGWVGFSNWEEVSNLYDSFDDDSNFFLGRGILFYTQSGYIEIYTDRIEQTASGELAGSVLMQVRDLNNVIVNSERIPVFGRFQARQSGTVGKNERISASFMLAGSGGAAKSGARNSIRIVGKENARIIDGLIRTVGDDGGTTDTARKLLPPPDDEPTTTDPKSDILGFITTSQVRLAGGGSATTRGVIRHSNLDPVAVTELPGVYIPRKLDYALATFYYTGIPAGDSRKGIWTADAFLDSDFGTSAGGIKVKAAPSTPVKFGRYNASARASGPGGSYRAKVSGYHNAASSFGAAGMLDLIDATKFPVSVSIRTPSSSCTLRTDELPDGVLSGF